MAKRKKLTMDNVRGNSKQTKESYINDTTFEKDFKVRPEAKFKERLKIDIDDLEANVNNGFFVSNSCDDDDNLLALKDVIKDDGISNPIRVKPINEDGKYVILSGHRRWMAALNAGIKKVDVIVIHDDFTLSQEIAYITRENVGGRADDPFGNAIMIQRYNKAQECVNAKDKVSAIEALRIKKSLFYQLQSIANVLTEELMLIGQKGYFTKETALNLCKLSEEHPTVFSRVINEILAIYNSDGQTKEEKVKKIKEIVNAKDKNINSEKFINGYSSFKKANSILQESTKPNFRLPKSAKRKEELKKICESIIESAQDCLSKLDDM